MSENFDFSVPDAPLDVQAALPEDLKKSREKSLKHIKTYQEKRIRWYQDIELKKVLDKDITLFSLRGIESATDFVEDAFRALESSSEETVSGNLWQQILADISDDTQDTGDLIATRENTIWVIELKSQPNTVNSTSKPGELRELRTRMAEITRRRRASNQKVKAALAISRDTRKKGKGVDQVEVFRAPNTNDSNHDLDGFEYRYITGEKFWTWLTGIDSQIALLMPLASITGGREVREARESAISRLKLEVLELLDSHNLGTSMDDVVRLRSLL
ncbi:PmeII family type II restriction endonuclease [Corynebacterium accolens]|uniref:PmeII family type II restriction endonuclease n=1 Tax=Corynebacterium accolens TaxID=38284 RepID=UPI00254282AE|nr:PmeII family type II restriction endonuclease [Corynebacterium accolens]MDK4333529.1 PmeII family type II restriction endonuclease [Corynebacterium accolens]